MPLIAYGINHKSAPLSVREQLSFSGESLSSALRSLLGQAAVNEAVLLSTCNRTEIYTVAQHKNNIENWIKEIQKDADVHSISHSYHYHDLDMVRHVMRVASGLDSMVLGEPQILGQMKQAYQIADDMGGVGNEFKRLFPLVFSAVKQIRSETQIGANAVSLAYVVVQLAKRIFSQIKDCRVLLVGAGETISLVANYLHDCQVKRLIVANRTVARAEAIAKPFAGEAIRVGDIPAYLAEVDIVVTATASQLPIIGKGMLERVLKRRKRSPILMADLAVPRDIEPEIGELEDVYLYNIDTLQSVIEENKKSREEAAVQAHSMVEIQATHYMRQLRVLEAGDMIRNFRRQAETLRDQELAKALAELEKGGDSQAVMSRLARNLTNKFLHQPTVTLRDAAYHEQVDLLRLIQRLFAL